MNKPKGGELSKLAGRLCNNPEFWLFLDFLFPDDLEVVESKDMAANSIRRNCGVESRAEIDHNEKAAKKFHVIRRAWSKWND